MAAATPTATVQDPTTIMVAPIIMVGPIQISVHHSPVPTPHPQQQQLEEEVPIIIHGAVQEDALAIFQNIPNQKLVPPFNVLYRNLFQILLPIIILTIPMRME